MLPTTGLVGGRGIGLNLFGDAIAKRSPAVSISQPSLRAKRSNPALVQLERKLDCFVASLLAMTVLTKPLLTPLDQLGADFVRLFLLRPMAAVPDEILLEIRHQLLHA